MSDQKFEKGDRVKLSTGGLRDAIGPRRVPAKDKPSMRGTVVATPMYPETTKIRWDGHKACLMTPSDALTSVKEG